MSQEIEVKLTVSEKYAEFFNQEITLFHLLFQDKIFLENIYYDTPNLYFAQNKMGLRIRKENQKIIQTLKTNGEIISGLHSRQEYDVVLSELTPDLRKMVNIYPEYDKLPKEILIPVFSTNFHRDFWVLEIGNGSEIEISLDRGNIIAGNLKKAICEIEFELKQGRIEDLLSFIKNLTLENDIRLNATSKAKQGYLLSLKGKSQSQNWLEKWAYFLTSDNTEKLYNVFQLEQDLIEETFLLDKAFFKDDFLKTVEQVSAFFNLFLFYSENSKLLEDAFLAQQEKGILHLDQSTLMNIREMNQYLVSKIKEIIQIHSKTRNNQLAIDNLFIILQTGSFLKRQLDLILLTI